MEPSGNNANSLAQHQHQQQHHQHPNTQLQPNQSQQSHPTQNASTAQQQQHPQSSPMERLSRPMAFDKMEALVREMQDAECGVPVRSQKLFLTSIPSAFMGYDLIEWLMERLQIEESEALNIGNQLCLHGYFFPVSDSKTLVVKDDSSLYRFQTPYYWPWQHKTPDNVEYAIYLVKRSLRNKQRHGLEDYEVDALASLHKNLKAKWDFITMQAEEQVKLSKDRKKGDKIVADSQERAFWRVHRPPPGQFTPLEPCPVPSRDRQGKPRRRTSDDCQRELDYLRASLGRTRIKMSQACEFLSQYWETFSDYDFFLQSALPSNPWVTDDQTFWQLNHSIVDVPTEKRVRRWAISIEELVCDPTGLQEFTVYLKKEYSHENIRFWIAVNDLRRSAHSQISRKVREIYEEFLEPGAPCEINIDGKTMEKVQIGLKSPSRFTFDAAAEHIYALLLKKDCYPRFIRSEHYKSLLATGIQPPHKKRFYIFGGAAKKKSSTTAPPTMTLLSQTPSTTVAPPSAVGPLGRRRGSERSLTGSAHELAVCGVKDANNKVPHSHSQSNLSDIPYREASRSMTENMESTIVSGAVSSVCPWEDETSENPSVSVSICPWEDEEGPSTSKKANSSSSDITEISERMRKTCGLRQNTLDCEMYGGKRLAPALTEPRRASITIMPRLCDMQMPFRQQSGPTTTTNLQHQPSFDTAKKIDDNVIVRSTQLTDLIALTTAIQSKTITVPIVQTSSSAQSLTTTKPIGLDDRDSGKMDVSISVPSTSTSASLHQIVVTKSIDGSDDVDDHDMCNKSNENTENNNQTKNICQTYISIIMHSGTETETETKRMAQINPNHECQQQQQQQSQQQSTSQSDNDETTKQVNSSSNSDCERKSMNISPPTITVLCAPCTDVILAETAAKSQSVVEQIECDIDSSETAQNESSNDDNVNASPMSSSSPTPVDANNSQLTLDAEKMEDCVPYEEPKPKQPPVVGQHEDLSPSMDEYQECCGEYKYDAVTAVELIEPGCIARVSTPAHLVAPLAEDEFYPLDDELAPSATEKSVDEPAQTCVDDDVSQQTVVSKKKKQKSSDKGDGIQMKSTDESSRNDVCPWEDEDGSSASDGTFVKTYSTLGYL